MTAIDSPADTTPEEHEECFHLDSRSLSYTTRLRLAGILAVLGICGFFICLKLMPSALYVHLCSSLPITLAVFTYLQARNLKKLPREIGISSRGLRIHRDTQDTLHPWETVGWVNQELTQGGGKQLRIFGMRGEELLLVTNDLKNFDILVEGINEWLVQFPEDKVNPFRLAKLRRLAWGLCSFGMFWLIGAIFLGFDAWQSQEENNKLKTRGVPMQAEVVSCFLAPDGITPRLAYRLKTEGHVAERNAQLARELYPIYAKATSVPVIAVPGELDISRLAFGEVSDRNSSPAETASLALLTTLLALFFLTVAGFSFSGREIDYDSKTSKFSIKKHSNLKR